MSHAFFYHEIREGVLCIWDLNHGPDADPARKSVTNDIEHVLAQVKAQGNMCSKVLVRDSTLRWDELVVDSAMQFIDWRTLQESDLGIALCRVRESVAA